MSKRKETLKLEREIPRPRTPHRPTQRHDPKTVYKRHRENREWQREQRETSHE